MEVNSPNVNQAFITLLDQIQRKGGQRITRGAVTRELIGTQVTLQHPLQRCVLHPQRRGDIFAAIAETMWVLVGRDDLTYLSHYLPRAMQFSDDGQTWRAAYGPRIRDFHGIDQLDAARRLLLLDPFTRRAVVSIYDPSEDFSNSVDVPCNNWLHFLQHDGRLDMHIAIRSNDVMWGFAGINTFEWSVLHEMMAYWAGLPVGQARYFISTLHLYERHFLRAAQCLQDPTPAYAAYPVPQAQFRTTWEDLAAGMECWFNHEQAIREGTPLVGRPQGVEDALLQDFLLMLSVQDLATRHKDIRRAREQLSLVTSGDLRQAAALRLGSTW